MNRPAGSFGVERDSPYLNGHWYHQVEVYNLFVRLWTLALVFIAAPILAQIRVPAKTEIAQAIRQEKNLGYNTLATANGARFSSAVILHFARQQAAAASIQPVLLLHRDFFDAFVEVSGLPENKFLNLCVLPTRLARTSISTRAWNGCLSRW